MVRYMHTTTYQKSEEEENLFHVDTPKAQNPSPEEIIANLAGSASAALFLFLHASSANS